VASAFRLIIKSAHPSFLVTVSKALYTLIAPLRTNLYGAIALNRATTQFAPKGLSRHEFAEMVMLQTNAAGANSAFPTGLLFTVGTLLQCEHDFIAF